MKQKIFNPPSNKLGLGITIEDVDRAIKKSGYPLQTIVANKLRKAFFCQEEWSFLDRNTRETRTLDIMAEADLSGPTDTNPSLTPVLNLLVECKQSDLPFIFFLPPEQTITPHYPVISGLHSESLLVYTNDNGLPWNIPLAYALSLDNDVFMDGPCAMTFSKCERKGKDFILSGSDAYHNIVLPLVKSLQHFKQQALPPKNMGAIDHFRSHLCFGIAVIDAPLIGVSVDADSHESTFLPWVRVFRHESYDSEDLSERSKLYAIDIVHKDFFDDFLQQHLLPFARRSGELLKKHSAKITSGTAFVFGLHENDWSDLEKRLQ